MRFSLSAFLLVLVALVPHLPLSAQGLTPLDPPARAGDLFVADATGDQILRLADLNLDGDYNDPGEVAIFYSDLVGSIVLTNPSGIAVSKNGTVFVCDTTTDQVVALIDLDGDGTAHGFGEHIVFFDGTAGANPAGILLTSPQELVVDANDVVWVANSDISSGGFDGVLRLEDLGGARGANDPGEASIYFQRNGAALGDSIPTSLAIGQDGFLYYTEGSSTGFLAKGIYRLRDDIVPNGNANDPGEVELYYVPSVLGASNFHWGLAFDQANAAYLTDHGNDVIWQVLDIDGDGRITSGSSEEVLFWQAGSSSLNWAVAVVAPGEIYTAESQSPDRILRIADDQVLNGNALDPNETTAVYDSTVASAVIGNPRSLAFAPAATLRASAPPQVGTTLDVLVNGAAGEPYEVWISSRATTGLQIAPFGTLFLGVSAGDLYLPLFAGSVGLNGQTPNRITIPNQPGLAGLMVPLQAWVGYPNHVRFTDLLNVTLLP